MDKQAELTVNFKLGRVVITCIANDLCERSGLNYIDLLMRHVSGDFGTVGHIDDCVLTDDEFKNGELATEDVFKLNTIAVRLNDGMILSTYPVSGVDNSTIWIITMLAGIETYTTILLPNEY